MATVAQLSVDINANLDGLRKGLAEANSRLDGLEKSVGKSGGQMNNVFGKLGGAITGAFAVGAIIDFGKEIIDITGQFQKLQAVLNNALGSDSEGQIAFAQIQDFAAKTNFSVLELTQSFVGLANRGIRPTTTNLTSIADVANALGKPLDDVVQAILDVSNTERWNELGIKVKKAGDTISATFRGQTVSAKATEQGALDLVTAIGKFEGVAGSTAAISQTLTGATSNLHDSLDSLFSTIGNRGSSVIIEFVQALNSGVQAITRMLASTDELKQQAFLGEVGKEADKLKGRVEELTKTNEKLGIQDARNAAIAQILADATTNLAKARADLAAKEEEAMALLGSSDAWKKISEEEIPALKNAIILEEKRVNVLNEMSGATSAVSNATLGLTATLKAQIKAQQEANEAATSKEALAAGNAALKNLNDQLEALQKLGTQNSLEVVTEKLEQYYEVLGNPEATNAAVANAVKEIKALEAVREALQNNIDARTRGFDIDVPEAIKPKLPDGLDLSYDLTIDPDRFLSQQALDTIKERFGDLRETMNVDAADIISVSEALRSGLTSAFVGLGEVIGEALSGTIDSAGGFFNALLSIVADFMKQFGAALISAGVAAVAFQNLLANPYAAIIAGIAVVAAATIVQSLLKKGPRAPGLATGTNYVPSDGLFYLHQGESVVPKKYNPALAGNGGGWDGEVVFRIGQQELIGTLKRGEQNNNRMGG